VSQRPRGLRGVGYRLADALELPKEVYFDLPRVVVIGNLQVSVENHRGLLAYDGNTVVLGLHAGRLVVTGEGLVVGTVGPAQITIAGRLQGLRFVTDEGPPGAER
jgi:sporulation protein YqfC